MQEYETCPHCGAKNTINSYKENCCEYCGGILRQIEMLTQITVSRKGCMNWLLPFDIILDGVKIGSLGVGRSLTRKVKEGDHILMCKSAGYKTAVLPVYFEGTLDYAFEVRANVLCKLEIVSLS